MPIRDPEHTITRIAALADPVRRALYEYVAGSGDDVSRDQAARAVRVARPLAAFHLDKLVEHGLLQTSYQRLSGRRGPGAGRPAKLYRRSAVQLEISLPARDYELAARLFARALAGTPPTTRAQVRLAARDLGRALGREARTAAGPRAGRPTLLGRLDAVLRQHGYEPFRTPDRAIRLRNCPFDALAQDHRPLVCGMNHDLLDGVVRGLGVPGCRAVLDPRPGGCCVALHTATPRR